MNNCYFFRWLQLFVEEEPVMKFIWFLLLEFFFYYTSAAHSKLAHTAAKNDGVSKGQYEAKVFKNR